MAAVYRKERIRRYREQMIKKANMEIEHERAMGMIPLRIVPDKVRISPVVRTREFDPESVLLHTPARNEGGMHDKKRNRRCVIVSGNLMCT